MTLGEKIQKLRKEHGLSQENMAAQLEVSRQAISKWELNDSVPEVNKVVLISEMFSVSLDYLLKDTVEEEKVLIECHETECQKNVQSDQKNVKILYIVSAFLVVFGLLLAIGGYDAAKPLESIIGGLIIHAFAAGVFFIAKTIGSKEK